MLMLLTPEGLTSGLEGMDLLQTAMKYHLGEFGVIFIAVILWLFSFFHLHRHPVLCPVEHRLPVRGPLDLSRPHIRFLRW